MSFNFNFGWGNSHNPVSVEKDISGNWFYTIFSSNGRKHNKLTEEEKLKIVLSSPAVLKAVATTADLGSLASVNKYQDEVILEKNFLYSVLKKPNYKQGWSQFFWEYFFWIQTSGTAYLYNPQDAKVLKETNPIQWLNPTKIDWTPSTVDRMKAFIFTKQSLSNVMKSEISYTLGDGYVQMMSLKEVVPFFDLCNGIDDNFYKGLSRIDALYKVIVNSEMALDAKYINLEMVQKFMVSGQADPSNTSQIPMGEDEKQSIEEKVRGLKKVHAVKSKISIERFVDNLAQLKLDDTYNEDMIKINSILNVPKDVLDIGKDGSTYENQEKATARQVEYSVKPKWKQLTDWFESQYGFQDIRAGYEDLSFNQVFEKDKATKEKTKAETLILLMKAGVPEDQINAYLGTNFKDLDYESAQRQQTGTNQQGAENQ